MNTDEALDFLRAMLKATAINHRLFEEVVPTLFISTNDDVQVVALGDMPEARAERQDRFREIGRIYAGAAQWIAFLTDAWTVIADLDEPIPEGVVAGLPGAIEALVGDWRSRSGESVHILLPYTRESAGRGSAEHVVYRKEVVTLRRERTIDRDSVLSTVFRGAGFNA